MPCIEAFSKKSRYISFKQNLKNDVSKNSQRSYDQSQHRQLNPAIRLAHLETKRKWSRNASRNCRLDRQWKRAGQLLPTFPLSLVTVSEFFAKEHHEQTGHCHFMKVAPLFLKEFPPLGNGWTKSYELKKTGTQESINNYLVPRSPAARCQ